MTIQLAPIDCHLINGWTVLARDSTPHSHTGSLVETTVASVTLPGGASAPAGSMGPNGFLRITSSWSCNNSVGAKHAKIKLGGVTLTDIAPGGTQISLSNINKMVFNRNAQNSQVFMPTNHAGTGGINGAIVTAAIDTSVDQTIAFSALLASISDTLTLESYYVEVFYGA